MTVDTFQPEIAEALRNFDRYVICLHKTPEEFSEALASLVQKAIKAYENRAAGLRHGIALDRDVTVILSQSESERPLCGIYFNLHSPYRKETLPTKLKPLAEETKGKK
jgi:hypothetical protein